MGQLKRFSASSRWSIEEIPLFCDDIARPHAADSADTGTDYPVRPLTSLSILYHFFHPATHSSAYLLSELLLRIDDYYYIHWALIYTESIRMNMDN